MTVITGLNESAKSSWHAAISSALVGRRRGKGATSKDERRFAELHKPWDGTDWRVSAIISLSDGRRIELTHDLEGKVDCRATDLGLSRDVSNEIMFEGSPDASRFLGLDRKSFAAIAVVNQAELLTILTSADGLQEHLQRAAATAGTDATAAAALAAAALAALEKFSREEVGLDRANSSKPMRSAKTSLNHAERTLTAALHDHEQYLQLVAEAEEKKARVRASKVAVDECEAAVGVLERLLQCARKHMDAKRDADYAAEQAKIAASRANNLSTRVEKAQELDAKFVGHVPTGPTQANTVSRAVTQALTAWSTAPQPRDAVGESAEQIRAELMELPGHPLGDTTPARQVQEAVSSYQQASAVAAAHAERRPVDTVEENPHLEAAIATSPAAVRELATQLAAARSRVAGPRTSPSIADQLNHVAARKQAIQAALGRAENAQARAHTLYNRTRVLPAAPKRASAPPGWAKPRLALTVVAIVVGVIGVSLLFADQLPFALVSWGSATVLALTAALIRPRTAGTPPQPPTPADAQEAWLALRRSTEQLEQVRKDLFETERRIADLERRHAIDQQNESIRKEVEARCVAKGLPQDTRLLHHIADAAEQVLSYRTAHANWLVDAKLYAAKVEQAETAARAQLASRGQPADPGTAVTDLVAAYEHACAERAGLAARAAEQTALNKTLQERIAADNARQEALSARQAAADGLRNAAQLTGIMLGKNPNAAEDDLVTALEKWQAVYDEELSLNESDQQKWAELQALLNGTTLEEMIAARAAAEADATRLAASSKMTAEKADQAGRSLAAAAHTAGVSAEKAKSVEIVMTLVTAAQKQAATARSARLELVRASENSDGIATERARSLTSVPAAEESVFAAEAELDRVTKLDRTLNLTHQFLSKAQDQVHRDIAPVLADALRSWMPIVTAGRYVDAAVDPATLQVKVTGPDRRWRSAERLSVGTAEQVYLLLRVALAQHLTTTGEPCPLLLDDVTVQADHDRTIELLNLLLLLSEHRQIVLFAQEPIVAAWAKQNLTGTPRHRIVELVQVGTD